MLDKLRKMEQAIVIIIILMMALVIIISTIKVAFTAGKEIFSLSDMSLDSDQLLKIFGLFLMLLIGLELIESTKSYLVEDQIHVEIVFAVALIAVARKIITLDVTKIDNLSLLGVSAIVVSLSFGYWLLKHAHYKISNTSNKNNKIEDKKIIETKDQEPNNFL